MYNQIFFTNVLRLIDELGLTKNELAHKAGISLSFLSDITTGNANPSLKTMQAVADALGTPLPALMEVTDMDRESLAALANGHRARILPKGFTYVSAVLTDFQAFTVRRWDRENRERIQGAKPGGT